MKRKLLMILSLVMVAICSVTALTACGEQKPDNGGEKPQGPVETIAYELVDGGYAVAGFVDKAKAEVVIPETYNGKAVVAIKDGAFKDNKTLASIEFGKNVEVIGAEAFKNCSNLATITFAEGSKLTTIKTHAFYNVDGGINGLINVVFPESLTVVETNAFEECAAVRGFFNIEEIPSTFQQNWDYTGFDTYGKPTVFMFKFMKGEWEMKNGKPVAKIINEG